MDHGCAPLLACPCSQRIVQDMIRERLREDLKKLCIDPEFASLLKCFSWPRLASRLEVYSNRVYEIVGDSSRWARPWAVARALILFMPSVNVECSCMGSQVWGSGDTGLDVCGAVQLVGRLAS